MGKLFPKIDIVIADAGLLRSRSNFLTSVVARSCFLEGSSMRFVLSAFVAVASLALPVVAQAATMDDFTVTGNGLNLTFSLPASPTVGGNYDTGFDFFLGDVSFTENGNKMTASDAYFYTKAGDGGFGLYDKNGFAIDNLDFAGPQLFTGGVKNPTFLQGMFSLQPYSCGGGISAAAVDAKSNPCSYTLTIDPAVAPAPTPEPGSLALLGTGALGAFGVLRRRLSL